MIHPLPPGTRDVLPEEMRELRALTERLRGVFEGAGYGEVWTPALEYEDVLRRGDDRAAGANLRMFDEQGNVLALRSDSTIPIARLVANRYPDGPVPIRLCYFAHTYRSVESGRGQAVEFLQGGIEMLGEPAPAGGAVENLRAVHEILAGRGLADRVILDLGLVRELGYYTGAVFEVYDPAVGFALGGGGRYDDLLGRFGRDLPACGIALDLQRVHVAQAAEEALR